MRLRRLLRLTPSDVALLCHAVLILLWIRFSLLLRPWNRFASPAAQTHSVRAVKPDVDRLEWAVIAAGRFIPRTTCLTRALTLHRLLSRYGYRSNVQFGIRHADSRFAAHAWVEHEARLLLSKPADIARYVRLFSWPPSQPDLS